MTGSVAISIVGRDRPGIVAALSEAMLEHRANIEDSRMTILRGHLAMTLVVQVPDDADLDALRTSLDGVRTALGLESLSLTEVEDVDPAASSSEPSHVVSVYGVDHPGIVHAVSRALADNGWNIIDLATRLAGEGEAEPLYAMVLEVAAASEAGAADLDRALRPVGDAEGVEISSRPLERDSL